MRGRAAFLCMLNGTTGTHTFCCSDGCIRWTIFGLTILAWIFSVVTLASCTFLVVDDDGEGLFSYENSDEDCEKWTDTNFNAADQVGRAFGVITNLLLVLAFVGISLVIFLLKENLARLVWMATRIVYVGALLSVLFTFAAVGSETCTNENNECGLGAAGICNTINVFILIGILSTVWCIPIPDEPMINVGRPRENNQNIPASSKTPEPHSAPVTAAPQVTKTIEMTPEGRKITEVVLHPDGSRTVTETFEEADDFPTEAGSY